MKKHLAIFAPDVIKIIFSGEKTIETRFSEKRIPPFGEVSVGDLVYIKKSGGEIVGQFLVKKVISFENLDQKDWQFIKNSYGKQISLGSDEKDQAYLLAKAKANFGTIIFIDRVEQFIVSPVKVQKRDQRGWVVLD